MALPFAGEVVIPNVMAGMVNGNSVSEIESFVIFLEVTIATAETVLQGVIESDNFRAPKARESCLTCLRRRQIR